MKRSRLDIGAAVLLAAAALAPPGALSQTADEPPPGLKQLLPRGRIAAVFEPELVTAGEAEIPDEAWVLGVAVDGEARAYSLNLLNHHEVVNDVVAGRAIAAVW
jgi:hypothetical protein